jgi:hypothetical protein
MPHFLAILFAIVRKHVDDKQSAAGFENPGDFGEYPPRLWQVVEHENKKGYVEKLVFNWQILELAASQLHIGEPQKARGGGVEHLGRIIDGNDVADVWRE